MTLFIKIYVFYKKHMTLFIKIHKNIYENINYL